jgi:hypothetical protein
MGTRGFVGYVIDDKAYFAYQQYDSYPEAVGVTTLQWLREATKTPAALRETAKRIRVITDGESAKPSPEDVKRYAHLSGSAGGSDWYWTLRNLQGDLGAMFREGVLLQADEGWPIDSLFCEWGYLVNLDGDGQFEVYEGWQHVPPTKGRWAGRPTLEEQEADYKQYLALCAERNTPPRRSKTPEYYAVALVATFPLAALPTDDEFVSALTKENA